MERDRYSVKSRLRDRGGSLDDKSERREEASKGMTCLSDNLVCGDLDICLVASREDSRAFDSVDFDDRLANFDLNSGPLETLDDGFSVQNVGERSKFRHDSLLSRRRVFLAIVLAKK